MFLGKNIPVLFENEYCLVLNKPSGLSVQNGEGIKTSLDTILAEQRPNGHFLIHRLDRDTSGIILVAKTKEAASGLSVLFGNNKKVTGEKKTIKKYLAATAGVPPQKNGIIKLAIDVNGRSMESLTGYQILSTGSTASVEFTLLELELFSGRMHQIRRHLSAIGNPVLGDDKYGNFKINKHLKKTIKLKKLLLHAQKLFIPSCLPFIQNDLDLNAPPPCYFEEFLNAVF